MKKFRQILNTPFPWIIGALLVLMVAFPFMTASGTQSVDTNEGLKLLNEHKATQAAIVDQDHRVDLTLKEEYNQDGRDKGKKISFYYSDFRGPDIVKAVNNAGLSSFTDKPPRNSFFSTLLGYLLPMLLIGLFFWFFLIRPQRGQNSPFSFGKSRAKKFTAEMPQVKFDDVAGADEAVEEVAEIKDFLQNPDRYKHFGARIPRGVLLYGPPGTGKTLLARAVAGEAGVAFYSISGSDFVEMFVGVGASRVRDLFETAKKDPAAIIFIDEIDAVGRSRGVGIGGGNDEREQTLNQLLVEMDGFSGESNVILIAATNRPDVLDPALLRPGRFDRQIRVDAPSLEGREQILKVHAKDKPLAKDVDLRAVAKKTPGFTGADLANVLNEAALMAAREHRPAITDDVLDESIDRVMAGPQKKSTVMRELERKITAYHEGGHALVAASLNNTAPVTKITILPRGRALGYTMVVPDDNKNSMTRNELLDQLAYAMGGRVAEEIVFHDPTTGASNDIQKATQTARSMVTQYGMSARLGMVQLGGEASDPFLHQQGGGQRDYSDEVAAIIDEEVRGLIDNAHAEAYSILMENRDVLDELALTLLERETLGQKELAEIFAKLRKHPEREVWLTNESRPVSSIPPVVTPKERAEAAAAGEPDPDLVAPQDQIAQAHLPSGFDQSDGDLPNPTQNPGEQPLPGGGETGTPYER
ncbi:ATP-dependent zinc metalloprotease FtsH [Falsarthrobacter nasiphocae]|uniref:ATP-dependent zinc metalloprotease FtsH n=1 Tax=Falsarthrobacter nasiphocae TaxID=189863 RepID=A0AAE3YGS7_9MICC|nr:ATP-dependent zinc metalloprotease FtsH [Falsarthrobacter nasiphocae]MDR6891987.1 cell division protease FtsH [Falsarthrobacter nasiphocae]